MEVAQAPSPNSSSIIYQAKQLPNYADLDSTLDGFMQYYINDFLPYFPNDVALDERKLIKAARQFYIQKGTPQSIQFLFRVLYNKEVDIYFPKDNILKASDGKWTQPQALRLLINEVIVANTISTVDGGDFLSSLSTDITDGGDFLTPVYDFISDAGDFNTDFIDIFNQTFDTNQLVQKIGIGSNSGAQCVIESAIKTVDPNLGFEIVEVFISNLTRPFNDLENLNVIYGFTDEGAPEVFSAAIIAELSNILINPNYRGTLYKTGFPVVLTGGLEPNDPQAQKAVAFVGNVTSGSISSINVNFGGYNYRQNPNTVVRVVNAPGDNTGQGANVIVSSLDTTNSVFVFVNTDSIEYKQNLTIGAASYNFSNFAAANQNTALNLALSFANLQFAPILSMNVIAGGGSYQETPNLVLQVSYYTDFASDLANISDFVDVANTEQWVDDLGFFAAVQVLNGGSGYSNVTDQIVCESCVGYGAVFGFITDSNGAITSVSITNAGAGYFQIPSLAIVNSTNVMVNSAGVGAVLQGYGFGQGANLTIGVDQIGQITDFNLVNRGFDYVNAPNVSLRIQDVVINSIPDTVALQPDAIVFQGANSNSAIFLASVDSYNVHTSTVRFYNYSGAINVYQNIIATTISQESINLQVNTNVSSNVIIYGDGKAKANAIFLNGLIQYPGFWFNTDGLLSSDQYLQDANTYHNFSYQLVVEKSLRDYKNTLLQLAHPAGMSMLGIYTVQAPAMAPMANSSEITVIQPLVGSVSEDPTTNGVVIGLGTSFVTDNIVNGSLIIFNTSDTSRRLQAKQILTVVNDTILYTESNTAFPWLETVSISNSSNVIISTGNDFIGNIAVNDVVVVVLGTVEDMISDDSNTTGTLDGGNTFSFTGSDSFDGGNNFVEVGLIYSLVTAVTNNTLTVNTVFAQNVSNLIMLVQPMINGASYEIVTLSPPVVVIDGGPSFNFLLHQTLEGGTNFGNTATITVDGGGF